MTEAVALPLRHRGVRYAYPIPDALMAAICAVAAFTDFGFMSVRAELVFALMVEGGFLMMQGTLVDIATRLKKRPPLWLAIVIVTGVAIFSEHTIGILRIAWERGSIVFVPLLISIAERGTVLWRLPDRTRIEKIAARALVANRITTGLVLFGLLTIGMIITVILKTFYEPVLAPFAAGAIYYAVATYDDWRVRGRRFAEKPRVLFRFDPIDATYLEPL